MASGSIVQRVEQGLVAAPPVGQVERLEHVREGRVPAARAGHGRLQVQETLLLETYTHTPYKRFDEHKGTK